jgi:hypothetical protein
LCYFYRLFPTFTFTCDYVNTYHNSFYCCSRASEFLMLCFSNIQCVALDFRACTHRSYTSDFMFYAKFFEFNPLQNFRCLCWSRKSKMIGVYIPNGISKLFITFVRLETPAPPAGHCVQNRLWLVGRLSESSPNFSRLPRCNFVWFSLKSEAFIEYIVLIFDDMTAKKKFIVWNDIFLGFVVNLS